jgi:IclR helix-turn-helix domain
MTHPDPDPHRYSAATLGILKLLARHGGCMRIDPLAREAGLPRDELCETLNTLAERRWLRIIWRRTPHATRPARLRNVVGVALTRLGRARLPVPWVWPPKRLSRRRRHPSATPA